MKSSGQAGWSVLAMVVSTFAVAGAANAQTGFSEQAATDQA